MGYDIPPQLEHKEKIMFQLTFQQLAYAFPAFLLVFYLIFKTGWPLPLSVTLSSFVVCIAVGFMFFDGKNRLLHLYTYVRHREVHTNQDILKEILDIQRIVDGVVHTTSSKFSILEITPLNFGIRTEQDQKSILVAFQKFLNSLDFPIQVHVSNCPLHLQSHFEEIKKKASDKDRAQEYEDFLTRTVKEKKVNNRRFHIIIPEKYDLKIQEAICLQKISSVGLKAHRLTTKQLLEYLYEVLVQKSAKSIDKNNIVQNYMQYLLSPKKITFFPDYFRVGNQYCKALVVIGYPHSVELGFLDKIIASKDKYDISIHIDPFPVDHTMVFLNRELQKQQADLYTDTKKGILNPSLEIKFTSTRSVLEEVQKGQQKLFDISLYILCKGKSLQEVGMLAKKVKANLQGTLIQTKEPYLQMIQAYESTIPFAKNTVNVRRNIHTEGLSALFPFSTPFLEMEPNGILLGLNCNGIPYFRDISKLTNANGLIIGTSGIGKSFLVKLYLKRLYEIGYDILILDPQGEYLDITSNLDGEIITISKDSESIINPLDLMGHGYIEKRLSLLDVFRVMFGELTEIQRAILDKAIELTYAEKGITKDSWKGKTPPILSDLFQVLSSKEKKCRSQERVTYRALLNRLEMYTKNGVFSFFDRQTNIDFSKNFICFNIGDMPQQVKPVVMYLITEYVYHRMKETKKRKAFAVDEAWMMFEGAEESAFLFEIVKTCRKFGMGLLLITQDVADLLRSKAGNAVLANTSHTFILRQKPSVMPIVSSSFNLSLAEQQYLLSAEKGQAILIMENDHQQIEVIASPKEYETITTDPNYTKQVKKNETPKTDGITISLDITKPLHKNINFSIEEKNLLSNHGYAAGRFQEFQNGKPKEYFVKKMLPEGTDHTFLVELICEELRKHTSNVQRYLVDKPDIVFINKSGREVALEIETGNFHLSHIPRLKSKFERVMKEYPDHAYIILTNMSKANNYKRFKLPLLSRNRILDFVKRQLE